MSERLLRSGKTLAPEQSIDQERNTKKRVASLGQSAASAAMSATALLDELKAMRTDLTGQITKLSDDLKDFQRNTNERLQKIESVFSEVEEIEGLKTKQQEMETDSDSLKMDSLNHRSKNIEDVEKLRKRNVELKQKLENLERYSRDFNIRVLSVNELDGEDCMEIIRNCITSLGFGDATAEVKSAHTTGKKRDEKPRDIIAKLYSRPFNRKLVQVAKSEDGKAGLGGVRIVEI